MSLRRRLPAPALFFALPALAALAAVIAILSIPADPKNSVIFGYSLSRLAMAAALLAAGLVMAVLSFQFWRSPRWQSWLHQRVLPNRRLMTALLWLAGALLLAGWVFNFLPLYRFGRAQATLERLRPSTIWLTFLAGEAFVVLLARRFGLHAKSLRTALRAQRLALWLAGGLLAAFLLLWGLMAVTGLGIRAQEDMWYEAGVPVLGLQILAAGAAALVMLWVEARAPKTGGSSAAGPVSAQPAIRLKSLDLVLFLAIWLFAAVLWVREPLRDSFFSPGPYPPNNAFYPYSDAVNFDSMSQYALIGQGIRNGVPYDRALYPAFLVGLHLLAGQSYARVAALQAGLLAVLPALLYLIGRRLFNRPAGVALAVLTALRGASAIAASTLINGSNPKLLMTDFFTALGMAALVWILVRWLLDGWPRLGGAVWLGGLAGLLSMVRTNPLIVAPLAMLLPLAAHLRQWRRWLLAGLLFGLALLVAITPWNLRNMQHGSSFLGAYIGRVTTVQKGRYLPTPIPGAAAPQPDPAPQLAPAASSGGGSLARLQNVAGFVSIHFLHNLVTSVLVLPTSPALADLFHTLRADFPYWVVNWSGQMPPGSLPWLGLNLALIALGIAFAWRRSGAAGLAPLVVFLGYQLSNGLARASGGRYIVPVDWVVLLYFVFGLAQVAQWLGTLLGFSPALSTSASPEPGKAPDRPASFRWRPGAMGQALASALPVVLLLLVFFAVGGLVPLSESVFPQRYPSQEKQANAVQMAAAFEQAGYSPAEVQSFLASEDAFVLSGRLLYPRYFEAEQGLSGDTRATRARPYARLSFYLLGPYGQMGIVLPQQVSPAPIPDGADVLVAGCRVKKYSLAALVLLRDGSNALLARQPGAPLACPPPEVQ